MLKKNNIPENATFIHPESIEYKKSARNPHCCLNPIQFVDIGTCHGCNEEQRCIYYRKYQYYKPQ